MDVNVSKASVLRVILLVALVAMVVLMFVYFQGGLSHAAPQ